MWVLQVQQETLFELILAANYMDIKPLLDLTCATVASMIKVGWVGSLVKSRQVLPPVHTYLRAFGHFPPEGADVAIS